jgi:hypothetical protein
VRAGFRLSFLRSVTLDDFLTTTDQLVSLVFLSLILKAIGHNVVIPAPAETDEASVSAPDAVVRPKSITRDEAEDPRNHQQRLVAEQDRKLLRQRKGAVDLYFVGFASYSAQGVFLKEITYTKELFDRRFDTKGRSVLLVNNAETKNALPFASVTNLRATLMDLGHIMYPDEDILFSRFVS